MFRPSFLLAPAIVVALAFIGASPALAAPTLVAPAANAVVTGAPTFSWQATPGESSGSVMVGQYADILTADGMFNYRSDAEYFTYGLTDGETSWTSEALPAGQYWWTVSAYDASANRVSATPGTFTVPAKVAISNINIRLKKRTNLQGTFVVNSNVRKQRVSVTVFKGRKRVLTTKSDDYNTRLGQSTAYQYRTYGTRKLPRGASLRIEIKVVGGGKTVTARKIVRA